VGFVSAHKSAIAILCALFFVSEIVIMFTYELISQVFQKNFYCRYLLGGFYGFGHWGIFFI